MVHDPATPAPPTPLHVLTGFLGSGKTTLLQRVLAATPERIAVVVNEVADLPIDARLLADYDEGVLGVAGGCLCCAMREDLHASLAALRRFGPDRIVLETSGLADPGPVLASLVADRRFGEMVAMQGVIAVVDAERVEELLEQQPEARRQLELSDRFVLTKADRAPHRLDPVRDRLDAEFKGRAQQVAEDGLDLDWLFAPPFSADGSARRWATAGAVDHGGASTRSVRSPEPVDIEALQLWLRLAAQLDGERILRIKAVARCGRSGGVFALQSAGRSVSPAVALTRGAVDVAGAEIVVIHRGLSARAEAQLLDALQRALGGQLAPGASRS